MVGQIPEAEVLLERALAQARAASDRAAEAEVLVRLPGFALNRGDRSGAWARAQTALSISRTLDGRFQALAHLSAATVLFSMGDLDAAEMHTTESLAASRVAGYVLGEMNALAGLGDIARVRRDLDRAQEFLALTLEKARLANHLSKEASVLTLLGDVAYRLHDYTAARTYGLAAGKLNEELGRPRFRIASVGNVAQADLKLGDNAAARRGAGEALRLARSAGNLPYVLWAIFLFGQILAETGQSDRGLLLYGLARAHPTLDHEIRVEIDEEIARLGLPAAEVEAGLAAGAALDLETVVGEILDGKW
jgi:tetratricopeptide (TPR) repeat protein